LTKFSSEIVTNENWLEFVNFLKYERQHSKKKDRNSDWFDYLLDKCFWETYPMWSFSRMDGEIWTISAVQKHNFPSGVYRVMSRLYVKQGFRRPVTSDMKRYRHNWPAKSAYLFPPQLDLINSIDGATMVMTMEHVKRRRNLQVITDYFNSSYETEFKVQPHMYQTFDDPDNWKSWQVLTSTKEVDIPYITVDEWKERFPEAGLSIKG